MADDDAHSVPSCGIIFQVNTTPTPKIIHLTADADCLEYLSSSAAWPACGTQMAAKSVGQAVGLNALLKYRADDVARVHIVMADRPLLA